MSSVQHYLQTTTATGRGQTEAMHNINDMHQDMSSKNVIYTSARLMHVHASNLQVIAKVVQEKEAGPIYAAMSASLLDSIQPVPSG